MRERMAQPRSSVRSYLLGIPLTFALVLGAAGLGLPASASTLSAMDVRHSSASTAAEERTHALGAERPAAVCADPDTADSPALAALCRVYLGGALPPQAQTAIGRVIVALGHDVPPSLVRRVLKSLDDEPPLPGQGICRRIDGLRPHLVPDGLTERCREMLQAPRGR